MPAAGPAPSEAAGGYLIELPAPATAVDDAWLARAVGLAARGSSVVLLAAGSPPPSVLPYFDAVALDPPPPVGTLEKERASLGGLPLVVPAADAAAAVRALAAGASAVLVPSPPAGLAGKLAGLLPEPLPASSPAGELPTAMRASDLATVVGVPAGFSGGEVTLPGSWYAGASLAGDPATSLRMRAGREAVIVELPPLPRGGVLIAVRPPEAVENIGAVEVRSEKLPTVAEVLARHQRAAARQERVLHAWKADQRLLVRVWVAELSRGFEVAFEGPAFFERGVGTDWEIARAWVDGVAWPVDELPDLPLLEPRRPPVPPLALRLVPSYDYGLRGVEERRGRRCYALVFSNRPVPGGPRRSGEAWIDAATFALVELDENAEGLPGDVRSSRSTTVYTLGELGGTTIWLPESVSADDLMTAFGGAASIHRDLTLTAVEPNPAGFAAARAQAYASPLRMLRDGASGLVPLVPDGRGGRVVGSATPPAQRFLLAGAVYDPGLDYPLPFGGLQIQDFHFRDRDEQLRLLVAGVVNNGAWAIRHGKTELSLRAFTQLIPFTSRLYVRGREDTAQEVRTQRQRVGAGVGRTLGPVRVLLDLGVDRLDFSKSNRAARAFRLPPDTWEGIVKLRADASVGGGTTVSLTVEEGWRHGWRAWGISGGEPPRPSWRRASLTVVRDTSPFPLARLHLAAELLGGWRLDRFSAFSPARFVGVKLAGIATDRILADRLAIARASLAVPLGHSLRASAGVDVAWAHDPMSEYRARPLAGIALGVETRGPWGTLIQASTGYPLATPGTPAPTFELFILRPLGRSSRRSAPGR